MRPKRKIYIASGLAQGQINDKFKQLDDLFERVLSPDDAEFVIVDLSNKHNQWMRFWGFKPLFFIPPENVPLLFVAFDKVAAADLADVSKGLGCSPPVYTTADELLNALAWWETAFPFYNLSNRNAALG